jgi:hypothetical protein
MKCRITLVMRCFRRMANKINGRTYSCTLLVILGVYCTVKLYNGEIIISLCGIMIKYSDQWLQHPKSLP